MDRLLQFLLVVCSITLFSTSVWYSTRIDLPREMARAHADLDAPYYESIAHLSSTPTPMNVAVQYSIATGFAVTENHLLTAGHYCERIKKGQRDGMYGEQITVMGLNHDGTKYRAQDATIVASIDNAGWDMCILEAPAHGLTVVELAPDLGRVETGDPVILVGNSDGELGNKRLGFFQSIREEDKPPAGAGPEWIKVAIQVRPGDSGSPLFWNGQVIGMAIWTDGKHSNVSRFERAERLQIWLGTHLEELR